MPIAQQDYFLKPGESISQYNARIAALRANESRSTADLYNDPGIARFLPSPAQGGAGGGQSDRYQFSGGVNKYGERYDQVFPNTQPGLAGGFIGPQVTSGNQVAEGDLLTSIENIVKKMSSQGFMVNPNVNIDSSKVGEFLAQAQQEIEPYYANQLKVAREGFLRSVGFTADDILRQEQKVQRDYTTNLRTLGEGAAEQGFALSGGRQRQEQELSTATQEQIDDQRRNAAYRAGSAARELATQYGTENVPSYNLAGAPRVLPGQFSFQQTSGSTPFYELSPETYAGLKGTQQFEKTANIRRRAAELESAYRSGEQIKQLRNITL